MRKQACDLTVDDLNRWPIWQFALDEEGVPGQDEGTVRPCVGLQTFDAGRADLVRTEFITPAGTIYYGFCTPAAEDSLDSVNAIIITPQGHVPLYFGALKPSADELERYYRWLNTTGDALFPLRFRCLVPAPGFVTEGVIRAFTRRAADLPTTIEFT